VAARALEREEVLRRGLLADGDRLADVEQQVDALADAGGLGVDLRC
jgi:hypothetical protein